MFDKDGHGQGCKTLYFSMNTINIIYIGLLLKALNLILDLEGIDLIRL